MRHFLHNSERAMVATRSARSSKRQRETYTVGPAVLRDTEQLETLMNGPAIPEVYTMDPDMPLIESAFLQEAIERKDYIVLVSRLLETNEIVGYVQAHILDGHWYVAELFVLAEHRKQGLGPQLVHGVLEAAEKRQGTQHVSEVKLEAETARLVSFYEKLGFEKEAGSSTCMRYALSREASKRAGG